MGAGQQKPRVRRIWREADEVFRRFERRRRIVYEALAKGQHRSWDYQPIRDAGTAYMRNNVVLDDLEARTRLPRVS